MNNYLWSNVFDNFCRTWYIEKGRCSLCGCRTTKTLRFTNYENPNNKKPSSSDKHCDLCEGCFNTSPELNRIDIFSFLAIRRIVSTKICLVCKRNVKRYINISKGSNNMCICYNCFVYGSKMSNIR